MIYSTFWLQQVKRTPHKNRPQATEVLLSPDAYQRLQWNDDTKEIVTENRTLDPWLSLPDNDQRIYVVQDEKTQEHLGAFLLCLSSDEERPGWGYSCHSLFLTMLFLYCIFYQSTLRNWTRETIVYWIRPSVPSRPGLSTPSGSSSPGSQAETSPLSDH